MKKNWRFVEMTLLVATLLFLFSACGNKKTDHSQHGTATAWQCPMKCEGDKTYSQAGSCPVCKMDLKQVEMPAGHDHKSMEKDSIAEYTCPMHPEIVRSEPGSCPICKMDLVKKKE